MIDYKYVEYTFEIKITAQNRAGDAHRDENPDNYE